MFEHEGPQLEILLQRLAETPPAFLEEPRMGNRGKVNAGAVLSDLLVSIGGAPLTIREAGEFSQPGDLGERNRLRLVLLVAWLFHDDWFQGRTIRAGTVREWVGSKGFEALASLVKVQEVISDPDRREEFSRRALRALNMRPAGETPAQAEDRLTTLDSLVQKQVLEATRAAERRAQEVREAMRQKEAQRSVPKYSRE